MQGALPKVEGIFQFNRCGGNVAETDEVDCAIDDIGRGTSFAYLRDELKARGEGV